MSTKEQAVLSAEKQKAFDGIFEKEWTISRKYFESVIPELKIYFRITTEDFDLYLSLLQKEKQDLNQDFLLRYKRLCLSFNILQYRSNECTNKLMNSRLSYNPKFSPYNEKHKGKYDYLMTYSNDALETQMKDDYNHCFLYYNRNTVNYLQKKKFLLKLQKNYNN